VLAIAFNEMLAQLRVERAQMTDTVENLRATEDELAAANRDLEHRVAQRTAQLEAEMKRRAEMEIELRQAQKLESVGRLASGIAHEINSPVQFVSHSCTFLDEASQSLIDLIIARRETVALAERGEITLAQLVARLHEADMEIDLDDLITDIPAASMLVREGLARVTGIVRAMKEFAYADQPAQTPSDLNRAIQNTLLVTCNEYKYLADTKVELGHLPLVTCHVGEFNQAVLNIIVNAAHAIQDATRGTDRRGCITIRTAVDGPDAVVSISDDGCGIPTAILDKIFDPFFTTKEIGRGSGQGLAIARSVIVDKHHGRLEVTSRPGHGSTFTIRLPIGGLAARAIAA
jgi:signal transduction histidine kinase